MGLSGEQEWRGERSGEAAAETRRLQQEPVGGASSHAPPLRERECGRQRAGAPAVSGAGRRQRPSAAIPKIRMGGKEHGP